MFFDDMGWGLYPFVYCFNEHSALSLVHHFKEQTGLALFRFLFHQEFEVWVLFGISIESFQDLF